MTVTHNGRQYTVTKLSASEWKLAMVDAPRNTITLNRRQMDLAGLLEQVEDKCGYQLHLRAAQNKAVIARSIGDGVMWMSAYNDMKAAIGYPWHRRSV